MAILLAEFQVNESTWEEITNVHDDVIQDHPVKNGLLAKRLANYVFPNNIGDQAANDLYYYLACKPKCYMALHFETRPNHD